MVTKKPVAPPVDMDAASKSHGSSANPPYPTTPTSSTALDRAKTIHSASSVYSPDLNMSPAFDLIDMDEARSRPRRDSDVSSHGTWDSDNDDNDEDDVARRGAPQEADLPKPLRIRPSQQDVQRPAEAEDRSKKDDLPAILRPGPAEGVPPTHKSQESMRYEEHSVNPWDSPSEQPHGLPPASNNPYRQRTGSGQEGNEATARETRPIPPQPTEAPPAPPVELPTVHTPAQEMSDLSFGEQRASEPKLFETAETLALPQQGQSSLSSTAEQSQQGSSDLLGTNNPWRTPSQENAPQRETAWRTPPPKAPIQQPEPQYAPPPGPPPKAAPVANLIDHPEPAIQHQPVEQPPQQPPRPAAIPAIQPLATTSTDSAPEMPQTRATDQRSENYSIKHVNWYDALQASDPRFRDALRQSPILMQNANGPCPLLALVNALVLSTPPGLDTALIETLRTREQISLGLLLDAVFDELMSGRRGSTAQELPDVGELYAFLQALHTGMNVNPRFITSAATPRGSLDNPPAVLAALHPSQRAQAKAGCFEETKEMQLYSTFSIPLIHGWVPPDDNAAYAAFKRSAQTFEDAQNIQFLEPVLEDKLRAEGLSPEEQQVLQDIQTIKAFLSTWPTQLTEYGLETISRSLKPGQIAILFRNDHFSTVYKEPKHGGLMTLVTDAGYSSHDEIVWESLVDTSGSASELFSGDFRVVSQQFDGARLNQGNSGGGEEGWQTVQNRNHRQSHEQRSQHRPEHLQSANGGPSETPPPLPGPRPTSVDADDNLGVQPSAQRTASEQEDHDLALALQLQEEEEDRQRQAEERRRREQELSERFLSTESFEGPRPPIPPRRSVNRASGAPTSGRPGVNRPGETDPDAPPTYEQSASDRPYRPAGSTAASGLQQGNPLNAYDALRRQHSGYGQQSSSPANSTGGPGPYSHGRTQSSGNRIRRRDSQFGPPGGPAPYGSGAINSTGRPGGPNVSGAASMRDAEDRCSVM